MNAVPLPIPLLPLLLALATLLPMPLAAQSPAFQDSPFWQKSSGWWQSSNTYFDGDLNYRIREYHSLVHLAFDGAELVETEYKFYPPGDLATAYGDGKLGSDEGIEVVTETRWQAEDESVARATSTAPAFGPALEMTTEVVADDVAVRRMTTAEGAERYRMLITLHGTDRRNIAHYGLAPDSESGLAGFAVFKGRRVAADAVDEARATLRKRHRVAATLSADQSGRPVVTPIKPAAN